MFLRPLLQIWLQKVAKAKLRDTVVHAVRGQLAQNTAETPVDAPKPCHLGIVFALGIESGCFEDLLGGIVTIRGNGFVAREGGLRGRRVVVILSGPGRKNAARATEILIDGHQPQRVVSAGFAGGLCPQLKRNDILVVDRLLTADSASQTVAQPPSAVSNNAHSRGRLCHISVELPAELLETLKRPGVHRGSLLTADHVVRLPREKQSLHRQHGALAVDMETFTVAEVCRRRQTPFSAVRVINDTADEVLPSDVEYLLNQKTGAAQFGAALGSIWRRPASAKDLYQLRENALIASGQLAKFLAEIALLS